MEVALMYGLLILAPCWHRSADAWFQDRECTELRTEYGGVLEPRLHVLHVEVGFLKIPREVAFLFASSLSTAVLREVIEEGTQEEGAKRLNT